MITIIIDGVQHSVERGMTVLEAARANTIDIPALCYHPALQPSGACKLCAVEVTGSSGRATTILSCVLKVKEGLSVKTEGELVDNARIRAFRKLLTMAPQSAKIRKLADHYGVDLGPPPDGCIRCRLCVRVCKEIVSAAALRMEKKDGANFVMPIEGKCIGCGTCVNICPTDVIRMEDIDNIRTISIRDRVIGRHPLEICEACGKRYATPKFLAHIEARTGLHPHVKEEHHYCPTCAKFMSDRIKSFSRQTRRLR